MSQPYVTDRWGHKILCAEDPPYGDDVVLTFDWTAYDLERAAKGKVPTKGAVARTAFRNQNPGLFVTKNDQKALKRTTAAAPKSPRSRDENNLAARPHAEIHHGNTSKGVIGRLFGSKGTKVTVHDPD